MDKQFLTDLAAAKEAEQITRNKLSSLGYEVEDISDIKEYYYKGDIRLTDKSGKQYYLEVKDDSRIADTYNVLCEYEVYWKENGYSAKGNMYCDSDYYCVVSKQKKTIYVIDFKILKQIYKKGEHKVIKHAKQDTWCYLLPLYLIKRYNGLVAELHY